ncbi:MAG: beta-ketoacyl-[acyl-carrier-protein] synthase family protein [Candidatus Riflebacteria bacterium]|nr:beta-ketoacyl-[acyl-carrier-protein] synthase family protein [Candidatus Riflebacteria bacterium]
MEPQRAVITGIGVISPIGIGVNAFAKGLEEGASGVDHIKSFDASAFPTRIAAEVRDFNPLLYVEKKKSLKLMGKNIQFAIGAAKLAVQDSGLDLASVDPTTMGVIMGASIVNSNVFELAEAIQHSLDEHGQFSLKRFGTDGKNHIFPLSLLRHLPNMVSCHISIAHNCQGINNTITTACAAGIQAVGESYRAIARGDARAILCGASDSRIDPLGMLSYSLLGAVSTRNEDPKHASRPFDAQRDGFVVGEGSAVFVLESLESARARGAKIYAEVVGYGSAADCFRVTDPHEEGRGSVQAMRAAIRDSRLTVDQIDYVAAHGTSTTQNDRMETVALKKVFGERVYKVPVSSIKSAIGHLGAACGAASIASLAVAIDRNFLPPTLNHEYPDPTCDLDYVPNEARHCRINVGLVNSFGFGGQNGSLVVRRYVG